MSRSDLQRTVEHVVFCRLVILTEVVQVPLQALTFCLWSYCFVLDSQWPFLWRSQWWKPLWRARISKLYCFRMTIHVVQIRWFDDLQSLTRFDVLPFHVAFWNMWFPCQEVTWLLKIIQARVGKPKLIGDFVGTVGQHQDYAMTEETFPSGYMFFSKLQVISQIRTAL